MVGLIIPNLLSDENSEIHKEKNGRRWGRGKKGRGGGKEMKVERLS